VEGGRAGWGRVGRVGLEKGQRVAERIREGRNTHTHGKVRQICILHCDKNCSDVSSSESLQGRSVGKYRRVFANVP
jgi:hypothetical protein